MLGKEEEDEEEVEVVVDMDMDKVSCCGEVTSATTILLAASENQSQDILVLKISVHTNCIIPIKNRI